MEWMNELSCPFCGCKNISSGEVMTSEENGSTYTQSECQECGALGPRAYLEDGEVDYGDTKAITAWNRRDGVNALLLDLQSIAHDNEYALGDRLQRISCRVSSVVNGSDVDVYTPHLSRIVEQEFDQKDALAVLERGKKSESIKDYAAMFEHVATAEFSHHRMKAVLLSEKVGYTLRNEQKLFAFRGNDEQLAYLLGNQEQR